MTHERYTACVSAFRDAVSFKRVAEATGVARATAKKAWLEGWPEMGMAPIKTVLEQEQLRIRAALEQEAQAKAKMDSRGQEHAKLALEQESQQTRQREQAKQDAVSIGLDEVRVVRASQVNAKAILAVANATLQASYKILDEHRKMVERLTPAELQEKLKDEKFVEQVHKRAGTVAYLGSVASQVAKYTMEMERMRVGKPVAVIGIKNMDATPAQMLKEIEAAKAAIEDAVAQGLMRPDGSIVGEDSDTGDGSTTH